MKKNCIYFLLFVSIFAFSACNKKEWKETVNTKVYFKASGTSIYFGANYLEIDTFSISMNNFSMVGNRIQAEDVFLVNPSTVSGSFIDAENQLSLSFDIPQGTYEQLQLSMQLSGSSSLSIRGTYHLASGATKLVMIDFDEQDHFVKKILQNGSETVLIDKDSPGSIVLTLDANVLFGDLNPSYWNGAATTVVGGQNAIQISNSENADMHSAIRNKISAALAYDYN